jgi:hypothetical protein
MQFQRVFGGADDSRSFAFETACKHTDVFSGIAAFCAGQNCTAIDKPMPSLAWRFFESFWK